ncbi:MAG: CRAL-TRIO domain-containing protein, partial [Olpidium bornovanus]
MTLPTGSDLGAVSKPSARQLEVLRALLPADLRDKHDNGVLQSDDGALLRRATLARFLVARDGNAAKAAEMLVACESWRKSRSLDDARVPPEVAVSIPVRGYRSVVDANLPGEETGLLPEYCHRLNKYWAGGGYHGVDRAGQPGYHDAKGLAKHVKVEEFVDWHIRNMELFQRVLLKECEDNSRRRALARSRGVPNGTVAVVESGNGAGTATESVPFLRPKMTAIFDCEGMGFHQFHVPALKFAQAVSELDQKYYPETLNMVFIVNAPRMFVSMWNIIKKWLNQTIIDKIRILGGRSDYQPVLTKYIPEHVLPTFLGGTCTCSHIPGWYRRVNGW